MLAQVERFFGRWFQRRRRVSLEPLMPIVFALFGTLLLWSTPVPTWQWLFLSLLAAMSVIGLRDPMRPELVAWRFITLAFAAISFLTVSPGLGSGFVLWLYALAIVYPGHIRQISIVAVTTAIAAGFACAEFWVRGVSPPLLHVAGVFGAGYLSAKYYHPIDSDRTIDPTAISILRINAQDKTLVVNGSVLKLWRDEIIDCLGDEVVIITTANRELAVLLPERSRAQVESIADMLRYRFSALALPHASVGYDTVCSRPRVKQTPSLGAVA